MSPSALACALASTNVLPATVEPAGRLLTAVLSSLEDASLESQLFICE